jgi:hypothetical protein
MRHFAIVAAALAAGVAAPAYAAQSTATNPAQPGAAAAPSSASDQTSSSSQNSLVAAQKMKKDLESAGFQDVKVVAESFVVQAKSKDGNPVLMTIGPHGMSIFEAMNASASNADKTGSITKDGAAPKK